VVPRPEPAAFHAASQTIDIRNGDMNRCRLQGSKHRSYGTVKSTLGRGKFCLAGILPDRNLHHCDGVSLYQFGQLERRRLWIQVPPNIRGTLIISRIAAGGFRYEKPGHPRQHHSPMPVEEDFTLTPSAPSRTIVARAACPCKKMPRSTSATRWNGPSQQPTTPIPSAQPKLYYLSPEKNGLLSSSPCASWPT